MDRPAHRWITEVPGVSDVRENPARMDKIMAVARLLDYDTVLDLGCLEGQYSFEFAKLGKQVTGIDIRPANIEKAEYAKALYGLENVEFVQADALTHRQYADLVLCLGVLYHVRTPWELIKNLDCKYVIVDTHVWEVRDPMEQEEFERHIYYGVMATEHDALDGYEERMSRYAASLHNQKSFWLTLDSLVSLLRNYGFSTVLECHAPEWDYEWVRDDKRYDKFVTRKILLGLRDGNNVPD